MKTFVFFLLMASMSWPLRAQEYNKTNAVTDVNGVKMPAILNLCGIGAVIREDKKSGRCILMEILPDSGAAEAGLQASDAILKIDGQDVFAWNVSQISEKLRGDPNTIVALTVVRQGQSEPMEIKVTRHPVILR